MEGRLGVLCMQRPGHPVRLLKRPVAEGAFNMVKIHQLCAMFQSCRVSGVMTNRRRVLFALTFAPLLGIVIWQAWPTREPLYRQKPLSFWLRSFDLGDNAPGKPSFDESVEAVRETSTNSLPILLRMLRSRDSDLKHRLARLAQKQSLIRINYVTADRQRWAARQGFTALGLYAKVAIPQLVEISREEASRVEWNKYATEILDLLKQTWPNAVDHH